jgi:predicted DsbA family dithiol-disulfide isomerase
VVERLKKEYSVDVEWRPFSLHPEWPSEGVRLPPHVRERFSTIYERLQKIADDNSYPLVRLDNLPNSRRALEASEYARAHGKHEKFHRVVFKKLYGEGQDIGKWEVLRSAAQEVGLDADEMQFETEAGNYRDVLDTQLEKAYALGITAVPTYIISDKYGIEGAQPFDVFEQVLTKLAGKHKESP